MTKRAHKAPARKAWLCLIVLTGVVTSEPCLAAGGAAGGHGAGSSAGSGGHAGMGGFGGGFGGGHSRTLRIPLHGQGFPATSEGERLGFEHGSGFGYNGGTFGQGTYLPFNSTRCLVRVNGPDGPGIARVC